MTDSEILDPQHDEVLPNTPLLDDETPFATMMSSFDEAATELGIDAAEYAVLRKPDREVAVSVPAQLDDGGLTVFDGYRIQHNAGLGPFLGPLRLQRDLKIDRKPRPPLGSSSDRRVVRTRGGATFNRAALAALD